MHAPQDQGSTSAWSPFLLPQWATQDLGRHFKVTLQEVLMINADCKKCNKFSSIPSLYQWAVSRTFLQRSPSRLYSDEKFASSKNQPVIRCNGPFPWRLMMRNQEVAWGGGSGGGEEYTWEPNYMAVRCFFYGTLRRLQRSTIIGNCCEGWNLCMG